MTTTIVCGDVDRQLFSILEKALGDAGYRTLAAHDGDEAWALIQESSPDLVLLDVTLPKRDGFEVLEQLRASEGALAKVPVLLTCASRITPLYQKRADALGAQGILAKPVPLDELMKQVRVHVKARPPRARRSQKLLREEGAKVEGSLAEVSFPHLLHHLHGLRATGVLMLSSGKKRKAIQLREGYPVAVKSNLVGECLGNHLVRTGKLSREVLVESQRRMKQGEGLQGEILVAMEVMSEEEVAAALREQAQAKLFDIFSWRRGRFKLEIGSRLKKGNELSLDASPANAIIEGVRNHLPLERIDPFLEQQRKCVVSRGESPFYQFQEIDLSEAEEALLDSLDGTRTLGELLDEDERLRRTLYALVVTEMIELRSDTGTDATLVREVDAEDLEGSERKPRKSDPEEERKLRTELAAMAERLRGKSYFVMLGLSESASDEDVAKAYGALARKAHPDRFQNASAALRQLADEVFGMLTQAHETLSDPERRKTYLDERRSGASRSDEGRNKRAVTAEMEFQLGESALAGRDYQKALRHFQAAREAAPREGEYLAHYAWCYHLCNPENETVLQEALVHAKRAAKLARDQEKPYLFLGRLLKAAGNLDAAQAMFTRAVQIRSDCVEAIRELRVINMRMDKNKGLFGRLLRR